MKILVEDIDNIISILQEAKNNLKGNKYFEVKNNKLNIKKHLHLPIPFCIKPRNNAELEIIYNFICNKKNKNHIERKSIDRYYHYPELMYCPKFSDFGDMDYNECYAYDSPQCEEITYKEFIEFLKSIDK